MRVTGYETHQDLRNTGLAETLFVTIVPQTGWLVSGRMAQGQIL